MNFEYSYLLSTTTFFNITIYYQLLLPLAASESCEQTSEVFRCPTNLLCMPSKCKTNVEHNSKLVRGSFLLETFTLHQGLISLQNCM